MIALSSHPPTEFLPIQRRMVSEVRDLQGVLSATHSAGLEYSNFVLVAFCNWFLWNPEHSLVEKLYMQRRVFGRIVDLMIILICADPRLIGRINVTDF